MDVSLGSAPAPARACAHGFFSCLAVVTGCTRGIGQAMVDELAEYGLNIILISRNRDSLYNVASDLGTFL